MGPLMGTLRDPQAFRPDRTIASCSRSKTDASIVPLSVKPSV